MSQSVNQSCEIVCRIFLPYVKIVFETVFNLESLQKMMGRTPAGVSSAELKAMCTLNIEILRKYLKDYVDPHTIMSEVQDIEGTTETEISSQREVTNAATSNIGESAVSS